MKRPLLLTIRTRVTSRVLYPIFAVLATTYCLHAGNAAPIHDAVKTGDIANVAAILDADPNQVNVATPPEESATPLMFAVGRGDLAMVKYLISRHADVNLAPFPSQPPISVAAGCRLPAAPEIARYLIAHGATLTPKNCPPPLSAACSCDNVAVAQVLISKGALEDLKQTDTDRLVFTAAGSGSVGLLKLLLEAGAPADDKDKFTGSTPLLAAVSQHHADTAALLVKHGADIRHADRYGKSPLSVATDAANRFPLVPSNTAMLTALNQRRVAEGISTRSFFLAVCYGNLASVKSSLRAKPSLVRAIDPTTGWTPLTEAVVHTQTDIVAFLLSAGADPNAHTRRGETPLHAVARYSGPPPNLRIARLLLKHGANPDYRDSEGYTPIDLAGIVTAGGPLHDLLVSWRK